MPNSYILNQLIPYLSSISGGFPVFSESDVLNDSSQGNQTIKLNYKPNKIKVYSPSLRQEIEVDEQEYQQALDNYEEYGNSTPLDPANIDRYIGKTNKIVNFANNNYGALNSGFNAANSILTDLIGDKMFGGPKGHITLTIDSGWNTVSDAVSNIPGIGKPLGLAMKGANLLNKGVNLALGNEALDNMTTLDAGLNNALTGWNVGLINAIGGQRADTITKDEEVEETVGSSYTGSFGRINDALEKSGKKYGLFSSGARRDANREIAEAKRLQMIMTDIANEATDRFSIRNSMAAINGNRRAYNMQGGYNQSAIRVGRNGLSLKNIATAKRIVSSYKFKKLKQGGNIPEKQLFTIKEVTLDSILPLYKEGGKTYNFKEAPLYKEYEKGWPKYQEKEITFEEWFNSIPKESRLNNYDYKLAWLTLPKEDLLNHAKNPSKYHLKSVSGITDDKGRIPFLKLGKREENPEVNLEFIEFYETPEAEEFRNKYDVTYEGDRYYYVPRQYQEGGKVNIIPEGALHARLHHIENTDNLTKKGIPVVSEGENGELEQQAEIEKDEVILRLEVTKKLEELLKKYYSDEYTKQEKDLFAIEAGKLLVYELLYNTQDNTGLINKIN